MISFKSIVRLRPLLESEIAQGEKAAVSVKEEKNAVVFPGEEEDEGEPMFFDSVLSAKHSQGDVYDAIGFPCVHNAVVGSSSIGRGETRASTETTSTETSTETTSKGKDKPQTGGSPPLPTNFGNSVIFSFGVTGSGKSYTLLGNDMCGVQGKASDDGLLPNVLDDLFKKGKCLESDDNDDANSINIDKFALEISMLEIYNEQVFDLLEGDEDAKGTAAAAAAAAATASTTSIPSVSASTPKKRKKSLPPAQTPLKISQDSSGSFFVSKLGSKVAGGSVEAREVVKECLKKIRRKETKMNR